MTEAHLLLVLVVATALAFDFTNGFHDTGNAMATSDAIGVHITKITDALPSPEDVARVEARLTERHGWPED